MTRLIDRIRCVLFGHSPGMIMERVMVLPPVVEKVEPQKENWPFPATRGYIRLPSHGPALTIDVCMCIRCDQLMLTQFNYEELKIAWRNS